MCCVGTDTESCITQTRISLVSRLHTTKREGEDERLGPFIFICGYKTTTTILTLPRQPSNPQPASRLLITHDGLDIPLQSSLSKPGVCLYLSDESFRRLPTWLPRGNRSLPSLLSLGLELFLIPPPEARREIPSISIPAGNGFSGIVNSLYLSLGRAFSLQLPM